MSSTNWEKRRLKHVTLPSSKDAHAALKQLLAVTSRDDEPSPKFYQVFVILTSQVQHPRLGYSAKRQVRQFLGSLATTELRKSVLEALLVSTDKSLLTLGYVVDYMEKYKILQEVLGPERGGEFKKEVLAKFVREVISPKESESEWILTQISEQLLSHVVTPEEFRSTLLPACQKAMLRSAETSIQRVGATLGGLILDLSEFSGDLGKMFATSLHSTDDASRDHALKATKILTTKIQQSSALKSLVERYFAVLNGSEGKLTVAAQKISILRAIGEMSNSTCAADELSQIAILVFDTCIKALDIEVHEGTLIEYLNVMSVWCKPLGDNSSPSFLQYVSKGLLNLKGSVRTSFCKLIATYFYLPRNKYLPTALDSIQKAFEKMMTQLFQGSNLMECICLALVLMVSPSTPSDSILQSIRNLPQHIDRKLTETDTAGYSQIIATLSKHLIEDHYEKVRPTAFDSIALAATVKPYQARHVPKSLIERLLKQTKRQEFTTDLIHAFERHMTDTNENVRMEILRFLGTSFKNFLKGEELEVAALELLPLSVCSSRSHYWLRIVHLMGLRPDKLVGKYWNLRLKKYVDGTDPITTRESILETLSLVHGEVVVESLVKAFQNSLKGVDFKKVTRDEYFIFHTPEGQLYDNSVLETGEFDVMGNTKRESKVYSYKEQLEEINLRKELEKKRREAGKEPKLTQKQKDVMKAQLEKEDSIRKNIRIMDQRLQSGFLLLNAALKGNVGALGFCVKDFLEDVIDLMSSSLSSPYAVKFYLDLSSALFEFHQNLGEITAQVSLKVFRPNSDLSKEYESMSLDSSLQPLLTKLTEVARGNVDFIAANYAFIFPFLKKVVHSRSKSTQLLSTILDCTMAMLKARINGLDHSPEFIQRRDLTKLLYHLIGTTEHRVQQSAVNVLLELAKSCGEPLSPQPDPDELHIHLEGFRNNLTVSRDAGLRAVNAAYPDLDRLSPEDREKVVAGVFQLSYDPIPEIEVLAKKIWTDRSFQRNLDLHKPLLQRVVDPSVEVRLSAAKALGELMEGYEEEVETVVNRLINSYEDYLRMTPPLLDDFGRVLQEGIDTWEGRHGVELAIKELAKSMSSAVAMTTMTWLVSTTFLDRNSTVHMAALDSALNIVQLHGKACMEQFATLIESHLDQPGDSVHLDRVRQSCVVLMGCLARHIDPKDPRVKSIFTTLLDTLSTPSEKVQEAVANCLPALVPAIEDEGKIIENLLKKVMTAEIYGERRGAAYGLAGMIKGLGVLSLKHHDVMNALAEGMQDKKNFRRREGALMALELLCDFLGRLFEPYIVHVLPYLLQCLGDGNQYVREATENTARAVMSRLSGHGVKLVLPALLTALNEDSWRTKCGSVDLLGRMAYCAPKQLSGCLPMIVPHLIEVLGDSHVKVQDSAAKALSVIGSVIRNPEIQTVVPILLQALQDPAKKTTTCLNTLLKTEFVHMVDSPSLALIMPVVERAFLDRSTENRRLACQIIGNMYSLTDHKDLAPYMKNVMPGIRASLLDPVPEVRTVAAKALGSMTRGMGEKCYDDLLPWLMKTLVSESNSVDRSGAAQGLAEVIGALGVDKLQRFMPEIIRKADSDDIPPHVRDGYMMMFIYMPTVFENDFIPYIGQIINPILKALADENEFVRETALRAGQRIVTGFADTAILLLLPQLRQGIFDDNWRIRYSSVQLLGDLLYKISGVSGKMSTESAGDDDNFGTENSQTLIIEKLGQDMRNQILAGLYMGRSDVALMVRQAALHVWKVIVANTPKTLREILPTLFSLILNFLASGSHDKRHVAARTLGDLVRKLGEKILPEIIPILEKGLECPRPEERQGVCIGLSEIMAATSREMVLAFVENLVPTLRKALCDPIVGVRRAAAQTFGSLHSTVGSRALDEILPFLLRKLDDEEEGTYALDGLGQVLQAKSKAVMPYLIPQLIAPPANMKALAVLCSVAGEALSRQLSKIFPVLIVTLKKAHGSPGFDEELGHCENVLLSVEDELGVRLVIEDLLDCCKQVQKGNRIPGILLLSSFLAKTKADIKPHVGMLLRALILLMIDPEPVIINAIADSIPSVLKHVGREDQIDHVEDIRQAIRFARSDLKDKTELPGLSSVKAVKALLGVFREAILNGPPEMKEQGANGMSELVVLANAEALKPSVIHVTGPLIRILGDRYAPDVKVAVLDAIAVLLPKVGPNLRAFLPQLQITFQKAVNDDNRNVRTKAEFATTQLVYVQGLNVQHQH